jgi:hypothetical protein
MGIATREQLLAKRNPETSSGLNEETVPLPGLGVAVRVRGLSRFETMHVQNMTQNLQREIETISIAMIEPGMSHAEVRAWMKAAPSGEFDPVGKKIQELSRINRGADKEVYEKFEEDPDAEFRVLSGGEAVDDSGAAATDDE